MGLQKYKIDAIGIGSSIYNTLGLFLQFITYVNGLILIVNIFKPS